MSDIDDLERLHALQASGALSEAEFEAQKTRILADPGPPTADDGRRSSNAVGRYVGIGVSVAAIGILLLFKAGIVSVDAAHVAEPQRELANEGTPTQPKRIPPVFAAEKRGLGTSRSDLTDWIKGWRVANLAVQAHPEEQLCELSIASEDHNATFKLKAAKDSSYTFSTSIKAASPDHSTVNLVIDTVTGSGIGAGSAGDSAYLVGLFNNGVVTGDVTGKLIEILSEGGWTSATIDSDDDKYATALVSYKITGVRQAMRKLQHCSATL